MSRDAEANADSDAKSRAVMAELKEKSIMSERTLKDHCGTLDNDRSFDAFVEYARREDIAQRVEAKEPFWMYTGAFALVPGFRPELILPAAEQRARFRAPEAQPSLTEIMQSGVAREKLRTAHFKPEIDAEAERVAEERRLAIMAKSKNKSNSHMDVSMLRTCTAPPFNRIEACQDGPDDEERYTLALDICRVFFDPIHVAIMVLLKKAFLAKSSGNSGNNGNNGNNGNKRTKLSSAKTTSSSTKPTARISSISSISGSAVTLEELNKQTVNAGMLSFVDTETLRRAMAFLEEQRLVKKTNTGYSATLVTFLDACALKVTAGGGGGELASALSVRVSASLKNKKYPTAPV